MKSKILVSIACASVLVATAAEARGQQSENSFKQNKSQEGKKMNKKIRNGLAVASAAVVMGGCGSGNGSNGNNNAGNNGNTTVEEAINAPASTLSQELTNTLSYMGNEERLAYDVYNKLYADWGTKQFTNIASKSEIKHIQAVQQLVQKYQLTDANFTNTDLPANGYVNTPVEQMQAGKYDIAKIQNLYDDLTAQGSVSEVEALKVGCTVEVVDVEDLDAYIKIAEDSNAQDVVDIFNFLRKGSYNHYWAFDKGLKNKGVTEGCCTWKGEDGSLNLCHPEYPQNEKGNGGKGRK
ncbi:MAG: DUF2202 domain-containing protein [Sulfurovum sp.]|nr:DUF2202 domain-containing protein [Sulfurovum sp.]